MTKIYKLTQRIILCLMFFVGEKYAYAVERDTVGKDQRSLNEALNPDGTLKQGINGSFNAQGFSLGYAKDGKPVFIPSLVRETDNGEWDNRASTGLSSSVSVLAVSNGTVYAGTTDNIYTWEGSTWSIVGGGVKGGSVAAIAISGTDLYVGGSFTSVGNESNIKYIAKWNGSTWSALGGGVNNTVNTIAVSETGLYLGGQFTSAGGDNNIKYIAKWNGNTLSALGTGVNGDVYAIATSGADVYVGGNFTFAGGASASRIAKWTSESSTWSILSSGLNGGVYTIVVSGTDLYVGGYFSQAGGITVNNIAKWNGSAWSGLGSGVTGGNNISVRDIAISGTEVYVGGNFSQAGGITVNNIAKWNGNTWSTLGNGINGNVSALVMSATGLYVAGGFSSAGGNLNIKRIAKWNVTTSNWSMLGVGMVSDLNRNVRAIEVSGTDLYVGGVFTLASGVIETNSIAKWNGNTWSTLGTGISGNIYAIAVSGTDVYVGGYYFTSAGGVPVNNIAKWDGNTWSSLGTGVNVSIFEHVSAIVVSGTDVYVGGSFTSAGGITVNNIAKWNGHTWSPLGTGLNGGVAALAVSGTDLYAGGQFTSAGGITTNNIAKWNGSTWSSLGTGVNGTVAALALLGTDVYIGGNFTSVGGDNNIKYITKWNRTTSTWSALGTGVNDAVTSLAILETDLYVGGQFTSAGSISASRLAKWSGTKWSALGYGVNGVVFALAVSGTSVSVGGSFNLAGDKVAPYFAIYYPKITPLPLHSLSLKAQKQNSSVNLQWQTEGEHNLLAHEVQKAGEGGNFTAITSLKAKNTSNAVYKWVDNALLKGNNYYRIKTIDEDGKTINISDVVKINFDFPLSDIRIYPNPTTDKINIMLLAKGTIVKLLDVNGKTLDAKIADGGILSFDIQHLPKGIYLVQYTDKKQTFTQKMIK